MVVALVALVAALAGNAIADGAGAVVAALKPNSVTSKQVRNGSLTLADFKRGERAKLRGARGSAGARGPAGPAGTPDGYTRAQADAAFLARGGTAANADRLDGLDSADFIRGSGAQSGNVAEPRPEDGEVDLLAVPGFGTIRVGCNALNVPGNYSIRFANESGTDLRYAFKVQKPGSGGAGFDVLRTPSGATSTIEASGTSSGEYVLGFARTVNGTTRTALVDIIAVDCRLQGTVLSSGG
jgi:hypothetical protein